MSRILVAYFSASGVTAKVAENLAETIGADIFCIEPEIPYTKSDLDWTNKESRSSIEMNDPTSRPFIKDKRDNMNDYDTVFVGKTNEKLLPSCPGAKLIGGKVLSGKASKAELSDWVDSLQI